MREQKPSGRLADIVGLVSESWSLGILRHQLSANPDGAPQSEKLISKVEAHGESADPRIAMRASTTIMRFSDDVETKARASNRILTRVPDILKVDNPVIDYSREEVTDNYGTGFGKVVARSAVRFVENFCNEEIIGQEVEQHLSGKSQQKGFSISDAKILLARSRAALELIGPPAPQEKDPSMGPAPKPGR